MPMKHGKKVLAILTLKLKKLAQGEIFLLLYFKNLPIMSKNFMSFFDERGENGFND